MFAGSTSPGLVLRGVSRIRRQTTASRDRSMPPFGAYSKLLGSPLRLTKPSGMVLGRWFLGGLKEPKARFRTASSTHKRLSREELRVVFVRMEVALCAGVCFLEPTCYGGLAMFQKLWKLCELFRAPPCESTQLPGLWPGRN